MSYIREIPFKPTKKWRKNYAKFKYSLKFSKRESLDFLIMDLITEVRKEVKNELIKCLTK